MNNPNLTHVSTSRAIPPGELREQTQRRMVQLMDQGRDIVAGDPSLSLETLHRMHDAYTEVMRIRLVLLMEAGSSSTVAIFSRARERQAGA